MTAAPFATGDAIDRLGVPNNAALRRRNVLVRVLSVLFPPVSQLDGKDWAPL
jgi:hypothetical protein